MRIRDLQARAVVAPLEPPVRTASGHVTEAPLLLIDLTTDEGIVGRSYLFGYHAFTLAPLRELVVALGEIVKGNVLAPVELDKTMRSRMTLFGTRGLQGVAVAGVDMAAWDALAVRAGVPLAEMLGSRPRPIPAYNSLGMIPPGEAADAAAKTVASGFKALKVKVGWPTLAEDLAVVRAARKHLGDDAALMVDYNQSLATPEARRGAGAGGRGAMLEPALHRGQRPPAGHDADLPLHRIPRRRAAAAGGRNDPGSGAPRHRYRVGRERDHALSRRLMAPPLPE